MAIPSQVQAPKPAETRPKDFSFHQLTVGTVNLQYAKERLKTFFMLRRQGRVCSQENDMSLVIELSGTEVNSFSERTDLTNAGAKHSLSELSETDRLRITVTPSNPVERDGSIAPGEGVRIVTSYATEKKISSERDPAAFAVRFLAYMIANHLYNLKKADAPRTGDADKTAAATDKESPWAQGGAKKLAPGVYMTNGK